MSLPLASASLWLAGCGKSSDSAGVTNNGRRKVKVGYMGLTCEAPLFVALENGFFEEQGVDVELVKCEWTQFKDLLALGRIDMGQQPVMMFLKPIEQGLNVKMTAGVHKGCLRIQAPKGGKINTVEDLRGKRIGVPGMGTPPFIFANRVLGRHKIDPRTEIDWVVFPSGELGLALQKGAIDAIATSEPVGSLLLVEGKVQNVADLGVDQPYADEYCCSIMISGKNLEGNRKEFASAVRAILKGTKWVQNNPRAAAVLSIEKNYLASNPELNAQALGALPFIPSIAGGRDAIRAAAEDMMAVGMLSTTTNIEEISQRIYVEFEGVTDEWLNKLEVQTVVGGQIPPDQMERAMVELRTIGAPLFAETCCSARSRILH